MATADRCESNAAIVSVFFSRPLRVRPSLSGSVSAMKSVSMSISTCAVAVVALTVGAAHSQAQADDLADALAGQRGKTVIVVQRGGAELTGRLLSVDPDRLQLQFGDRTRDIDVPNIARIDRPSDPLANGAIIGAIALGGWCAYICGQGLMSASQLPAAIAANAAFGALVGAGIDAFHRHRTTVYVVPRGGAGVAGGLAIGW